MGLESKVQMVTAVMLAKLLGVNRTHIYALEKKGTLPERDGGQYPLLETVNAYCAHLRKVADKEDGGTLAAERTRLAKLKGDSLELELKVRAGELLEADGVEKWIEENNFKIRTRLSGHASKATPLVHGLKKKADTYNVLSKLIDEALRGLAGNDIGNSKRKSSNNRSGRGKSKQSVTTTTKKNSKSVGRPRKNIKSEV